MTQQYQFLELEPAAKEIAKQEVTKAFDWSDIDIAFTSDGFDDVLADYGYRAKWTHKPYDHVARTFEENKIVIDIQTNDQGLTMITERLLDAKDFELFDLLNDRGHVDCKVNVELVGKTLDAMSFEEVNVTMKFKKKGIFIQEFHAVGATEFEEYQKRRTDEAREMLVALKQSIHDELQNKILPALIAKCKHDALYLRGDESYSEDCKEEKVMFTREGYLRKI
ncbi:hypothetical protein bcgnr5372_27340 [Bacillus luti]|nr:hypothetical protein [Bacillus cereus]HDR8331178.1 hypothetical protein [Bacillus cereus]HDR8338029.1 hypothetical protein [Bacillus cereus]